MSTGPGPIEEMGRTRRSGFVVFLYVLLGIGGALVLTCGVVAYRAWQDPRMREMVNSVMTATTAPGTEELRQAGCQVATVIDVGGAADLLVEAEGADDAEFEALASLTMVQCVVTADEDFSCERVARVYREAVPDSDRVLAMVMAASDSQPRCQQVFDREGALLGDFEDYLGTGTP